MGYIPELLEDEVEHSLYCNRIVNAPKVGASEDECVVWANPNDRILLVTNTSSEEQRKLAHDVSRCANHEMNYDFGIYHFYEPLEEKRQVQIFLYVRDSHVVGMVIIEKRTAIWRCAWNEAEAPSCVEQPEKAWMWSVSFIWVHRQQRRTGIANMLFKESLRVLNLGQKDIGWYTPLSPDGEALVRKLYPIQFFVAK